MRILCSGIIALSFLNIALIGHPPPAASDFERPSFRYSDPIRRTGLNNKTNNDSSIKSSEDNQVAPVNDTITLAQIIATLSPESKRRLGINS